MNIVREIRRQNHGGRMAIQGEGRAIDFDTLLAAVDDIRAHLATLPSFQKEGIPRIGVSFPN